MHSKTLRFLFLSTLVACLAVPSSDAVRAKAHVRAALRSAVSLRDPEESTTTTTTGTTDAYYTGSTDAASSADSSGTDTSTGFVTTTDAPVGPVHTTVEEVFVTTATATDGGVVCQLVSSDMHKGELWFTVDSTNVLTLPTESKTSYRSVVMSADGARVWAVGSDGLWRLRDVHTLKKNAVWEHILPEGSSSESATSTATNNTDGWWDVDMGGEGGRSVVATNKWAVYLVVTPAESDDVSVSVITPTYASIAAGTAAHNSNTDGNTEAPSSTTTSTSSAAEGESGFENENGNALVGGPSCEWQGVAIDGSGQKISVGCRGVGVYVSADGGSSWTLAYSNATDTNAEGVYRDISMSADGSLQLVATNSGLLVSTASGAADTFTPQHLTTYTPPGRDTETGSVGVAFAVATVFDTRYMQATAYAPDLDVWVVFEGDAQPEGEGATGVVWRALNGEQSATGSPSAFHMEVSKTADEEPKVVIENTVLPSNSKTYCIEQLRGMVALDGQYCMHSDCSAIWDQLTTTQAIHEFSAQCNTRAAASYCCKNAVTKMCSTVEAAEESPLLEGGCFLQTEVPTKCTSDDECIPGQFCDTDTSFTCTSQCAIVSEFVTSTNKDSETVEEEKREPSFLQMGKRDPKTGGDDKQDKQEGGEGEGKGETPKEDRPEEKSEKEGKEGKEEKGEKEKGKDGDGKDKKSKDADNKNGNGRVVASARGGGWGVFDVSAEMDGRKQGYVAVGRGCFIKMYSGTEFKGETESAGSYLSATTTVVPWGEVGSFTCTCVEDATNPLAFIEKHTRTHTHTHTNKNSAFIQHKASHSAVNTHTHTHNNALAGKSIARSKAGTTVAPIFTQNGSVTTTTSFTRLTSPTSTRLTSPTLSSSTSTRLTSPTLSKTSVSGSAV